jgi:hypothetical protein
LTTEDLPPEPPLPTVVNRSYFDRGDLALRQAKYGEPPLVEELVSSGRRYLRRKRGVPLLSKIDEPVSIKNEYVAVLIIDRALGGIDFPKRYEILRRDFHKASVAEKSVDY